ncbi:hypothetical protein GNZ12_13725 [Paraburkholderia sp. 1N]|uniref:Glycosyl transferase family 1 domain-containing protein n=1 Tax=Paraburkholderia solitsugae TaxID=2675748 RepID=A0ABX2BN60_9BURK|nr:hypothetical protein [Paraburkholderia solitsugae]NPT42352.1 hypothetical protein [Paraburkholderia solitsugae]
MNAADGHALFNRGSELTSETDKAEYCDLLIIDEMLPCDFSPFRSLEYSHYLEHFESSLLLSTEGWHGAYSNLGFAEQLANSGLPEAVKRKIRPFSAFPSIVPKLAYITFLANAWQIYPYLVDRKIPFILQLYPGGQFEIDSKESDSRLRTLLRSELCRKVIVTQNLSRDYLLNRIGCDPRKIEFIYGGVYDTDTGFDFSRDKKLYGRDKRTLDICFVAHRYGDDVKKKGYDQFVAIAKALANEFADVRFHVVGDYTPDQIPLGDVAERIKFHGKKPSSFFRDFYPQMDIIVSVNRPSAEGAGAFDGFPTGACMEAGFRGVVNCISDPLNMNVAFKDNVDVMLVDLDTRKTIERLTTVLRDTDRLYSIARANWLKFIEVFDTNQQLWDRTRVATRELLKYHALIVRPSARMSSMDLSLHAEYRENARQYDSLHKEYINLQKEYLKLQKGYQHLEGEYRGLEADYLNLESGYRNLEDGYRNIEHGYRTLENEYLNLAAGAGEIETARAVIASQSIELASHGPVEQVTFGRAERLLLRLLRSRYLMRMRTMVARMRHRTRDSQ